MKLDLETVRSLARGHRTMWPHHRTRAINEVGEVVGYACDGVSDFEPCPVDWTLRVTRPGPNTHTDDGSGE